MERLMTMPTKEMTKLPLAVQRLLEWQVLLPSQAVLGQCPWRTISSEVQTVLLSMSAVLLNNPRKCSDHFVVLRCSLIKA
mmetsp:Transcript_1295/g.3986  ORF Transcript_1295/g.3986 Transcript_1295/m.3986 type:complete len:80 (-) Transcript_1295:745-984(-)